MIDRKIFRKIKVMGEVMSVLIYGIDNEAKGFPTLIVSSEVNFHTIWEPAINELQLTYIGNQRWLYRKDLDRILEEFNKLLDFSRDKAELDNIYFHVSDIIDNLKEYWDDTAPNADRLWMG